MVAGGSAKSCRGGPNCSPGSGDNDQNCANKSAQSRDQKHQGQSQNCNKGLKRRAEPIESGAPSVVLSSVSTNVSHQDGQLLARCIVENCSTYSTPSPQMQCQPNLAVEAGGSGNEGNDNCESCCEGASADYDYEAILTKILNEKKLALSRSPEVIKFLQQNLK